METFRVENDRFAYAVNAYILYHILDWSVKTIKYYNMKYITSLLNAEIKNIAKLKTIQGRRSQKLFIAEGLRTCNALATRYALNKLYCTEHTVKEAQSIAQNTPLQPIVVTDTIMQKISSSKTASGILAVFNLPKQAISQTISNGIVLAQVQDPGNMGTLIRTAAAVGASTVVTVEGCDPWSPKVIQSGAGAHALVTIADINWSTLITHKKELPLYALVVKGGITQLTSSVSKGLLVIGNEAHGIPQEWIGQCNSLLTLAMPGGTESLNAAVAGSIALYLAYVGCA
jgi:RNA methyltransferase, TrmH family